MSPARSRPLSYTQNICVCLHHPYLCEIKARILKDPSALEEVYVPPTSNYMKLQIIHKRNYVLQDSNGLDLAVLNQKTTDALRSLDSLGSISYEAYVASQDWKLGINTAKNAAGTAVVDIEINVHGPSTKAEEVGRSLSNAHLFLQRPSVLAIGATYQNPHVIHFAEIQGASFDPAIPNAPELVASSTRKLDIQDVFGGLDQSGNLKSITVDERLIRTKLRE
ncbi:P-loop containing nucleoside triphosphate hydrolase [Lasiodiplodia theobromae]|uniref:P-loop containing nucleoside triphosphate hydrolase n=1 Tax=Lasiodiplodia theobromae TaxID=45133 RepID=A0A8H7INP4_9PEZI|nr:P-loop containing nucleoside triphosphate hydrolase [Lasiodiplodia theobromae]